MQLLSSRRDIADLIELIRFVQDHRTALIEGGQTAAVVTCDELLVTLNRELRTIYQLRWCDTHVRRPVGARVVRYSGVEATAERLNT